MNTINMIFVQQVFIIMDRVIYNVFVFFCVDKNGFDSSKLNTLLKRINDQHVTFSCLIGYREKGAQKSHYAQC